MKEDQTTYLHKWLNGELTDTELEAFKKTDAYKQNVHLVEVFEGATISGFNEEEEYANLLSKKRESKEAKNKVIPLRRKWLRIAAAVVLLLSTGYIMQTMFKEDVSEHNTLVGEMVNLELPDHSNVWVNAKSHLYFDAENWKNSRVVELIGEGYFQVAKGKAFTVKTKEGTVTVLGTKFNVKHRDNIFEVKCYEGKVQVTHQNKTYILKRGEGYNAIEGVVSLFKHRVTIAEAPTWIDQHSYFEAVPLHQVFEDLKLHYDVTIHLDTKVNKNQKFTGGYYYNEPLDKTLNSICAPFGLSFKIEGKDIYIE